VVWPGRDHAVPWFWYVADRGDRLVFVAE